MGAGSPGLGRSPSGYRGVRGPARNSQGRLLYGVAAGVGEWASIDPTLIRVAFAILSLAGGLGIVLYLGLALVLPERSAAVAHPETRGGLRSVASVALITTGLLLGARRSGFWFGDAVVLPIAFAAFGAAVLWVRSDPADEGTRSPSSALEMLVQGRVSPFRLLIGAVLILVGMGTFLAVNSDPYTALPQVIRLLVVPVIATLIGVLLIFGPWLYRLASQLTEERRERIRSEERTALAAHLHDSVLQTLALIQRANDPQRMSHLARTQERELRAWLFGKSAEAPGETFAGVLEAMAGRCESRHPVSVDVVVVGDAELDERLELMTAACGEAINNAAKHSGAPSVSVYAEAEPEVVTIYVRDEGTGFVAEAVGVDRRGISDSIQGRMRRAGGSALIQSEPGAGTEVILTLPRGNP